MTGSAPRSVAAHLGLSVLAGGLAGGGIAAAGALPALLLRWADGRLPDLAAWWGMPVMLGVLGGAVGLIAGLLFGPVTLGLRTRGADRRTRRSVALAVAVIFGGLGGALLSLFWMGAADGGGVVLFPGAIAFCVLLAFVAADAVLARLVPAVVDAGPDAGRGPRSA
ncbi:MAG TPA: hypothetical protein VK906_11765 [Egicoccus sp.]|nr:hypothetical protein [Egicoccus sp.]HSK23850.1 hypothetical protein [Egicoccus sp.]